MDSSNNINPEDLRSDDFICNPKNCMLDIIYPNSEASLACDMDCHLSKGEDGFKFKPNYYHKLIKKQKECNH